MNAQLTVVDTGLQEQDELALLEFHQFIRNDAYDEAHRHDWRVRMARKYYDKLYKEYAIIDLSRYKEGAIGMRFRTETELIDGIGQYSCAAKKQCNSTVDLHNYEVPFQYRENGEEKMELVKVIHY